MSNVSLCQRGCVEIVVGRIDPTTGWAIYNKCPRCGWRIYSRWYEELQEELEMQTIRRQDDNRPNPAT